MQTNLKSLFAGKREAVEVPPKKGPGRPPKVRKEVAEEPDVVLEAVQNMPDQPEAYDEQLRLRHRKRKFDSLIDAEVEGPHALALSEEAGKSVAQLRMPGIQARDSSHEGPQVKLRLCKWFEKSHEDLGGTDEVWDMLVSAVAEKWHCSRPDIVRIVRNKAKWRKQCDERGVTAHGMKRDEAHLPRYLRRSKRCKGQVRRAKGGGRKDKLLFCIQS